MSARIEVPQLHRTFPGTSVFVAVVVAAVVGGLAGSAITRLVNDRTAPAPVAVGAASWDAGKLQAMQGRQLAAELTAVKSGGGVSLWDAAKLDAMHGRQLAARLVEPSSDTASRWNAAKLDAIKGITQG
jgi:hypothetical protein